MKKIISNEYLLLAIRIVIACIFIIASIQKIMYPASFANSIMNYRLLPDLTINIISVILPWLELICGILLLIGNQVKETILIINILLISFIILIITAIVRGLDISCGCYGTKSEIVGIKKIIENVLLLLGGFLLQKYNSKKYSINTI